MSADMTINFSFRVDAEDIKLEQIIEHFSFLVVEANKLIGQNDKWYETGFSKKQARSRIAFEHNHITENTLLKWEKIYKKDSPFFVESVWDGVSDYSSSINYRKMFCDKPNRVNVELHIMSETKDISINDFISLFSNIACNFKCIYINADNNGYRFFDRNVFPDRLTVGWMLYLPITILPELIPQAEIIIPVLDGANQKGTIVIATKEMFDGSLKEHIEKSNDIEIRLLDLGLLPLITEL